MVEIIILSIVQGLTEFLPISSSAHLILVSKYFNFSNENLTLDLSLHFGSLLAIIFYFKKELLDFINNKKLFLKIILSSVPVIVFGFILVKLNLIDYLRNYKIIGWTTIFFGILLYVGDLVKTKKTIKKDLNYKSVFYIGFFQAISLIPGVSRSGITITAGRFLNFSRTDSSKISFLMSIPTLTAVGLYNFKDLYLENNFEVSKLNIFAIILSFIFSFFTIKLFFNYIRKSSLTVFVIYRIFLGLVVLFFSYT
tara:strand:- start:48 stop:806 length:759 start_codon:yes stop_codon:yes gene_type:complete